MRLAPSPRPCVAAELVDPISSGVVLVSGGADSACAAAGLAAGARARERPRAARQLRPSRVGRSRRARLPRPLREAAHRPPRRAARGLAPGNLQAAARDVRYAAAERLRARTGGDWIATGHTRTDLAETVLYRLAVSPGARALRGLPAAQRPRRAAAARRSSATRRARLATEAGLPFADDETNLDPDFARNRIRAEVLPVLRELSPAAERNIAETQAELVEEARAARAGRARGARGRRRRRRRGGDPGRRARRARSPRCAASRCARSPSAPPGAPVPLGRRRAAEIMRLAALPEGGEVELGGGVRAICEHGLIRFVAVLRGRRRTRAGRAADPGQLPVRALGGARRAPPGARSSPAGPDLATLDAEALGEELVVRTWREGDRMRPLGMDGTKTPPGPVHRPRRAPLAAASPARGDGGRPGRLGRRGRRLRGLPPRPAGRARSRSSPPASSTSDRLRERLRRSARSWSRAEELQRRVAELGAEISRDYEGRDLVMIGVLKGAVLFIADLMRAADRALRGRLHGRLQLRLRDRLLGRRADPQGPRRLDRGPRRADRRGHRRLRADAPLPAAQPAGPEPRARSRSARCSPSPSGAGSSCRSATSASRSRTASRSATGSITHSATGTCATWPC